MITVPAQMLKQICDAAEAAYPREACGLLIGRRRAAEIVVTRVVASDNLAPADENDSFEVDPQVRFDAMRAAEAAGEEIVGHYHSHPDHPAQPSTRDLSMAYEPELAWLITSVVAGQAVQTTAHVLDAQARQFRAVPLRTPEWVPYPLRDPKS